jgi:hypothetical protein
LIAFIKNTNSREIFVSQQKTKKPFSGSNETNGEVKSGILTTHLPCAKLFPLKIEDKHRAQREQFKEFPDMYKNQPPPR